mmetsp:Transcript_37813/g.82962  ORF Transcript_37813/g.82962 Transcript_37813/m.82962 type:complete len:160 (-) Transcript_37813:147-626(-)
MGCCDSKGDPDVLEVAGMHGIPIRKGDRVFTQYHEGNGMWFKGTVLCLRHGNRLTIKYDDGDRWTGDASTEVYKLPAHNQGHDRWGSSEAPGPTAPPQQAVVVAAQKSDGATYYVGNAPAPGYAQVQTVQGVVVDNNVANYPMSSNGMVTNAVVAGVVK